MQVFAHEPSGFEGSLVRIEVDIRLGIPAVDLVGLAAGAVREARDRVRAAIRNSGFDFPRDRVLINLAPADLPKEGSAYDLPLALAILGAAGSIPDPGESVLALGELRLDGAVRPVRAVLPAVAAALSGGIQAFIVPSENAAEARALGRGAVHPIARLGDSLDILARIRAGDAPSPPPAEPRASCGAEEGDMAELRGQAQLRRALEIAAAGGHHLLLIGPPGSGKTMAARRFRSILPDLEEAEAVAVAALRSLAGLLPSTGALDPRPPFRAPHHSASLEGLIGGGRLLRPGEISLAHRGVLFLDEAAEFRSDVLQSLREPIEEGRVRLVRASSSASFPADFQLILAANPCPCGALGRPGRACLCSIQELQRYRRKIGGPLLDRMDIRVPVLPVAPGSILGPPGESSARIRARVEGAVRIQRERFRGTGIGRNSRLGPESVAASCALGRTASGAFERAVDRLGLSSRACHSILKIARTIADLAGEDAIAEAHILEAVQHRRFGEWGEIWPE